MMTCIRDEHSTADVATVWSGYGGADTLRSGLLICQRSRTMKDRFNFVKARDGTEWKGRSHVYK